MDVDAPTTAMEPASDQDQLVTELGELLEETAAQPQNTRLLCHQVDLMLRLGMLDEAADAAETLQAKAFVGEGAFLHCSGR